MVIIGVGGIIGILFGFFIIVVGILRISGVEVVYLLKWVFMVFGILVLIGVIFGMFLVEKAVCLNFIEVLRYE